MQPNLSHENVESGEPTWNASVRADLDPGWCRRAGSETPQGSGEPRRNPKIGFRPARAFDRVAQAWHPALGPAAPHPITSHRACLRANLGLLVSSRLHASAKRTLRSMALIQPGTHPSSGKLPSADEVGFSSKAPTFPEPCHALRSPPTCLTSIQVQGQSGDGRLGITGRAWWPCWARPAPTSRAGPPARRVLSLPIQVPKGSPIHGWMDVGMKWQREEKCPRLPWFYSAYSAAQIQDWPNKK